tara:strand:+ start:858 stop:1238 length:381 start_codon:yes stop_codon:yes gene_type:complete
MLNKIKNFHGIKNFIQIILVFVFLIIFPINANSAELLQINDVNTILVGDQNRSIYISLYCIDINEKDKVEATEILRRNFPRGTKVKIKPYGSNGQRLLAKVFRVDEDTEMTELLETYNSSEKNCIN